MKGSDLIHKKLLSISTVIIFAISSIISFYLTSIDTPDSLKDFLYTIRYIIVWFIMFESLSALKYELSSRLWYYCGIEDLKKIIEIVIIPSVLVFIAILFTRNYDSIRLFISFVIVFSSFYTSTRLVMRLINDMRVNDLNKSKGRNKAKRTLIVGAGQGASLMISNIKKHGNYKAEFISIVDDDISKNGMLVQGVPVIGTTEDIEKTVKQNKIDQITIAIPSLDRVNLNRIVETCLKTGKPVNTMPKIEDVMTGEIQTNKFKEIEIEDLLGRESIKFDTETISDQLMDSTILVTGAGGSIGSEICRQVLQFIPKTIILVGHGENSIYQIEKELLSLSKTTEIVALIADVQDGNKIDEIFREYKPDFVYHAAAHKHVPLMEMSPKEAVKNNVIGTRNVAQAAVDNSCERFVMISTDKAVNPTSVMGASKRLAEIIVQNFNGIGETKFVSVRFGNVLGSRGSVVPLFKEQIQNGGPITITDKRMTRYFMTIPEASQLVIQAGSLAKGGEVFVLDMGESVKIVDLAKKMIELYGLHEDDIEIREVGMRPGEKLYEETLSSTELVGEQVFKKIFVGKSVKINNEIINNFLSNYKDYSNDKLRDEIMKIAMIGYEKISKK